MQGWWPQPTRSQERGTAVLSTTRERALATLIAHGPMHRADLARALDVSRTTVTNITQDLMAGGILTSDTGAALKTDVRMSTRAGVLLSVVFRLRSTSVAVGSLDGHDSTLMRKDQDPSDNGAARLSMAQQSIDELLSDAGQPRVLAAHVAVNTQIDIRTGEVMGGQASRMWSGVNPMQTMQKIIGAPVIVENTARLLALSEYLALRDEAPRNLLYVHLSHGIAMGQVLHGVIVQGSHGGAGELGHMSIEREGLPCECGNRGCLMQYVDEKAILNRAKVILGPATTVGELLSAASDGSRPCRSLLADVGTTLGEALVSVCHLLDPDVIVLGGRLAGARDLLTDSVHQVLEQRALPLNARGLVVTTASQSTTPGAVVDAGLYSLRADTARVEQIVRAICS